MAAPNRVEELRKRYHENPRRFFAPLANEYRKTGFPDRAILLCEKHLGEQPDNLNGLVVYGQTLYESGRTADAKTPFEMALKLDPENLIALRHLGDIAKDAGDNDDARRWYERVLEFDRRNEEVLALLESVGGAQEKEPPSGPSSAPSIVNVASSVRVTTSDAGALAAGQAADIGMIDLDAPAPVVEPPSAPRPRVPTPAAKTVEVSAQPKPAKRTSLLDIAFDFGDGAPAEAAPAAPVPAAPVLGAEAAEYGFAATTPAAPAAAATPQPPALEDMPTLITDPVVAAPPPAHETPAPSLIELPPEPVDLGAVGRIEGLEAAEFSAEVSPLAGLEPAEFQSEDVAPLSDLAESAFTALGSDAPAEALAPAPVESAPPEPVAEPAVPAEAAAPDLEVLPPEPDADFGGTMAFSASRLEELAPPPPPRPTDGLPLLEPFEDEPAVATPPASSPSPTPPAHATPPAPFVTETMAELYVKQGHRSKAIEVYRQLIAQSPTDASLREKLERLESAGRTSMEFEAPKDEDFVEPTPAPANAMLAEMSFEDLDLATPTPAPRPRQPTPAKPAVVAGPSAREYLAAFARRGFTPLSSPVIAAPAPAPAPPAPAPDAAVPGGGLDLLFGPDVNAEDERAAHRLAGVGALAGPSGGSRLDSLFGEGPSAPLPPELASARPGVARASDKLRFDQFFTATSAPEAAPTTDASSAPPPGMEEPGSAPPPEDDDLDQFHGWLRGLTQ